jgi:hypothetical protein
MQVPVPARTSTERWLSGRKQRFAKPSRGQKLLPGFESPPLRHDFETTILTVLGTMVTDHEDVKGGTAAFEKRPPKFQGR